MIKKAEEMIDRDFQLITALNKMKPEDKKEFLPKVERSIQTTQKLIQSLKS